MENNEESKITVSIDGAITKEVADTPTSLSKDGLLGKVKEIKETRYKAFAKFGKVYLGEPEGKEHENNNSINYYTLEGAKTKEIKYNVNGGKYTTEYNDQELTTRITSIMQGGMPSHDSFYVYNETGGLLNNKMYDKNGKQIGLTENTYNSFGKIEESVTYVPMDTVNSRIFNTYNDKGFLVESKHLNGVGEAYLWMKHKPNSKGHSIEQTMLNPDGTVKNKSDLSSFFDSNGDYIVREHKPYIPKDQTYEARTENDIHGNWIKKITYYDDKPVSIFIREISYYGDETAKEFEPKDEFFNPPIFLKDEEVKQITEVEWNEWYMKKDQKEEIEFTPEESMWLAERTPSADNFPYFAYYLLKNKTFPCQTTYLSQNVDAIALLGELEANMDAIVINRLTYIQENRNDRLARYTLTFKDNPAYVLHAMQIQEFDADNYEVPAFIDAYHDDTNYVYISQMVLLHPNESSPKRDEYGLEDNLREYMEKCTLERIPDKPEIYMVEVDGKGQFSLQSHNVKEDFEIDDLDIQYGYGFEKFHDDLMDRFKNESQGLVLFHGLPGTGKTYYIRHLLKEMSEANKIVIYMPPNMVDYLVDPGFMTFLQQTVSEHSADGNFCVLLIEDAEPLLASRNADTRIQGVTNLLNMTDGLLNDMLKLQIICTFNVELRQLDAALLRPGRLIARKEFKALGEIEANLLAQSLGIKHHFKAPATLSEIYALLKNKNTLIHDEY